MAKLTKNQKEEIHKKSSRILEKTTKAFSKLEKEYNIKNMCFSGIHTDEVDWVSSSSYTFN